MRTTLHRKADFQSGQELFAVYQGFLKRKILCIALLGVMLVLFVLYAVTVGAYRIPLGGVFATLAAPLQRASGQLDSTHVTIVWSVRLPRLLLGVLAGLGLGVAGSVMQGVLRNPLASPYTLGVSAGASLGAAVGIALGRGVFGGPWVVVANAFVGAVLCVGIILLVARYKGSSTQSMILSGITLMYLFSAVVVLLQFFASDDALRGIVFWMIGSLDFASWQKVAIVASLCVVCVPYLMVASWKLNVLSCGDEMAESLGLSVRRTRNGLMIVVAVLTAGVISFTGTIGFVGLVAPHVCRLVLGADHRYLLPASALVGGFMLVGSDLVATNLLAPISLPVGAITAFLGCPLLFYLLLRNKRVLF